MKVSYRITMPIVDPSEIEKFRLELVSDACAILPTESAARDVRCDVIEIDGKSYEDYALDNAGCTKPNPDDSKYDATGFNPTVQDVLQFATTPAKEVAAHYSFEQIRIMARHWLNWIHE